MASTIPQHLPQEEDSSVAGLFDPAPLRPDNTDGDETPSDEHVDFVVYYAGCDYASTSRMLGKLRFLHSTCRTWETVCNPRLSINETVEQLSDKIISRTQELDIARLAKQLKQGERLHGGHGNRGPITMMMDFIKTQMRLQTQGATYKLYVDVTFPEVITLLRERGYDPIPINAAWMRKRRRIYPWWLNLIPQRD